MTPSTPQRRLAGLTQAAEHLDIHPRTLRRRIADGSVAGYRVGRLIKVDLDEAEAVLLRPIPSAGGGRIA